MGHDKWLDDNKVINDVLILTEKTKLTRAEVSECGGCEDYTPNIFTPASVLLPRLEADDARIRKLLSCVTN